MSTLACSTSVPNMMPSVDTHYPRMSTLAGSTSVPNMMPSVDTHHPRLCMSTLACSASVPKMMPNVDDSHAVRLSLGRTADARRHPLQQPAAHP